MEHQRAGASPRHSAVLGFLFQGMHVDIPLPNIIIWGGGGFSTERVGERA